MIKSAFVIAIILGLAVCAPAKSANKNSVKSDDDASAPAPEAQNPWAPNPGFSTNMYPGSFPNPNPYNPWTSTQQRPWAQPPPYSGLPAPIWSPNSQFNPYNPVNNQYTTAAYPATNPMHPSWGHPALNPGHPLNNPWHPANAFPAYPSYAQMNQYQTPTFLEAKGKVQSKEAPASPFAEAQSNWNNYFAGPTSEYTWPGAPEAAPGVHPNLGGRLNPFNPLGAPSHPYPFPMHQGLKNGSRHPRPFTATGQYYPGQSEIPPNFFGPAPIFPGFPGVTGFNPYFAAPVNNYAPAAKNGRMN